MKTPILLLFCCCILIQLNAQTTSSEELGLKHSLPKGQSQLGVSTSLNGTYSLSHRFAIKDNLLLRTRFNIPSISFIKSEDNSLGFFSINAHLGLEKHTPIGKKWTAYYGGEIGVGNSRINSGATVSRIQRISIAGFVGIKYNVKDKISLFAEYLNGYGYSKKSQSNDYIQNQFSSFSPIRVGVLIRL